MKEEEKLLSNSYSHKPDERTHTPDAADRRENRYNKDLDKSTPIKNDAYKADGSHIDKRLSPPDIKNVLKKN